MAGSWHINKSGYVIKVYAYNNSSIQIGVINKNECFVYEPNYGDLEGIAGTVNFLNSAGVFTKGCIVVLDSEATHTGDFQRFPHSIISKILTAFDEVSFSNREMKCRKEIRIIKSNGYDSGIRVKPGYRIKIVNGSTAGQNFPYLIAIEGYWDANGYHAYTGFADTRVRENSWRDYIGIYGDSSNGW